MGREMLGGGETIHVPIFKDESRNVKPEGTELTRQPDAYDGLMTIGRELHRLAEGPLSRIFPKINRQRAAEIRTAVDAAPESMTTANIDDLETDATEALAAVEAMEGAEEALVSRVDGRGAIIAELEKAEGEL